MGKISSYAGETPVAGTDTLLGNSSTGPTTKQFLLSNILTYILNNIPATEGSLPYVSSGLVITADAAGSTRAASMTAGRIRVNTTFLAIAAVTARVYTASKDTYVDILDNLDGTGTIVYTEVTNNAASPALASNSVRIGTVVTGATTIAATTSIGQGGFANVVPVISSQILKGFDTLGNIIYPKGPNSPKLTQNPYKFSVYRAGAWTDGSATYTKVQFDTKVFDTGGNYDVTTNFRFTAPVAGFYQFNAWANANIGTGSFHITALYKNGALHKNGTQATAATTSTHGDGVSAFLQLSIGDYIEVFHYGTGGVGTPGPEYTWFQGFLVSAS